MEMKYAARAIKNFAGPYIKHLPEIQIIDLTPQDEYLVLATDGLWDFLSAKNVGDIISEHMSKEKIVEALWKSTIKKAAEDSNMKMEDVLKMNPGKTKRSIHDDITIMVLDLKKQVTFVRNMQSIL